MNKFKKYTKIFMFVLLIFLIAVYGITFARYASSSAWNYYLESKGFYLSSDYLDIDMKKNVNNMWDGSKVEFNVKNALNNSVISAFDITYKVTCEVKNNSNINCDINDTTNSEYNGILSHANECVNNTNDGVSTDSFTKDECDSKGYSYEDKLTTSNLYFNLNTTDNSDINDADVIITVSSSSPYKKTIKGEFILHRSDTEGNSVNLNYKNYTNYDRLIISNPTDTEKCVKIAWNSDNLLIDNDKVFDTFKNDSNGYVKEIDIKIASKESDSYKFYSRNDKKYDVKSFSLMDSDECKQ